MSQYARARATAERLLAKYGAPVTLSRETTGAYDPTTGGVTTTPASVVGVGVLLDVELDRVNDSSVRAGDAMLYYIGQPLAIDDTLDGKRVASFDALDPAREGDPILYTAVMRA